MSRTTSLISVSLPKFLKLLSTNMWKIRPAFYTPSVNSAFCFIASIHARRSPNASQPNALITCRKIFGQFSPKNWVQSPCLYFWWFFQRLRDLMANIFVAKHAIDNWERRWKLQTILYIFLKFCELFSTISSKYDHTRHTRCLKKRHRCCTI